MASANRIQKENSLPEEWFTIDRERQIHSEFSEVIFSTCPLVNSIEVDGFFTSTVNKKPRDGITAKLKFSSNGFHRGRWYLRFDFLAPGINFYNFISQDFHAVTSAFNNSDFGKSVREHAALGGSLSVDGSDEDLIFDYLKKNFVESRRNTKWYFDHKIPSLNNLVMADVVRIGLGKKGLDYLKSLEDGVYQ